MENPRDKIKPLLIYTMTSGLGDFIVMGDVARKIERIIHGAKCLIAHRNNPHIRLWPGTDGQSRFFSIYSLMELSRFIHTVSLYRKTGYTSFGLQMAPGSIQGFLFYKVLKKFKLIDYIVDFNLINSDIITPPRGDYILDLHLNQVRELLRTDIPPEFFQLRLPMKGPIQAKKVKSNKLIIGIHPWSRRGHISSFVWPFDKWLELIQNILLNYDTCELIVLGRDKGFDKFKGFILEKLGNAGDRISFSYSNSVDELVETISMVDALITVNTAVVHIGYALQKKMFILNGPSLDLWVPKDDNIHVIRDKHALLQASDKWEDDDSFGSITRIDVQTVINTVRNHL